MGSAQSQDMISGEAVTLSSTESERRDGWKSTRFCKTSMATKKFETQARRPFYQVANRTTHVPFGIQNGEQTKLFTSNDGRQ